MLQFSYSPLDVLLTTSGPESNLEAFNYYPADGSYGTLPDQVMPDQISEIKVPLVLIYISLCCTEILG